MRPRADDRRSMYFETGVLIPLPSRPPAWPHVGFAAIEQEPQTGMSMLYLRLSAMAPTLFLSLADLRVLLACAALHLADEAEHTQVGHA